MRIIKTQLHFDTIQSTKRILLEDCIDVAFINQTAVDVVVDAIIIPAGTYLRVGGNISDNNILTVNQNFKISFPAGYVQVDTQPFYVVTRKIAT